MGAQLRPGVAARVGLHASEPPCAATFFLVFRALDRDAFEQVLGRWASAVLADQAPTDALALDGKALRGSRKQGAPGAHLLSVVSQSLGLTVAQAAVGDKTNEIPVAPAVLRGLVLKGRVVTMDALLTQREVARTIVDGGGDYLLVAKGNQPQLEQDIATVFSAPRRRQLRAGRDP
ncbi:MAG: ISAs1 family transposase [Chloroflexi bacterium]|nr:ISAs1 family transposase [Chloroflexota bacterium]